MVEILITICVGVFIGLWGTFWNLSESIHENEKN